MTNPQHEVKFFSIVGRKNQPLLVHNLGLLGDFEVQTLTYTSLDYIESFLNDPARNKEGYLGIVNYVDNLNIYSYCTNSKIKFVAGIRWRGLEPEEPIVRALFLRIHDEYVRLVSNPFYNLESLITNEFKFINQTCVRDMACFPALYIGFRRSLSPVKYFPIWIKQFTLRSNERKISSSINLRRYRMAANGDLCHRLSSGLYLGLRFIELQMIFLPLLAISPLIMAGKEEFWYKCSVKALIHAGPAFIKLGQWASTRPDLFPLKFCRILGQLHSNSKHHCMEWNRYQIKRALGFELEDIFSEFESVPIGSGSVGQVHRARMASDGSLVAVKILHPNVKESFQDDLQLLNLVANLVHSIHSMSWLHLPEELAYFSSAMKQQLDLRYEAYTLSRFDRNFRNTSFASFPIPIASTEEVLIESYESGLPVSYFTHHDCSHPNWPVIKKAIAIEGLQSFLQMLLWDNFVHADLHPGNMLVRFDGSNVKSAEEACEAFSKGIKPTIVFLDTGLVTELSKKDFTNFTDLFKALVFRADGYLAAKLMIERAPGSSSNQVLDPDGFCLGMKELIEPIFAPRSLLHLDSFSVAPAVFKVFDMVREHHIRLEGAFTNLVMSLICVEGLGRELSPNLSLRPVLFSAGLQYLATNIAKSVADTVNPYI